MSAPGATSEVNYIAVDSNLLNQLWQIYRTDATCSSCAGIIKSRLLGLGVMYASSQQRQAPKRAFFELVTREYSKFCRDALDQLLVMGFCAYTIVPPTKAVPYPTPVAVPFGVGSYIFSYDKNHRIKLGFKGTDRQHLFGSTEKPDANVLFVTLTPPDSNGRPVSAVAQAYGVQAIKRQLEMNVMFADRVRARPPVLTQHKTDQTFDDRDVTGLGAVEGDVGAAIQRKNLLRRNMMNVELWQQQAELVDALNTGGPSSAGRKETPWSNRVDPVTGLPVFTVDGGDSYTPSFIPLPSDATVASMTLPSRPVDFIEIERFVSQQTAICMGINPQALQGTFGRQGATTGIVELTDSTISFTIMKYRSILSEVLLDIYGTIFGSKMNSKRRAAHNDDGGDITVIFPSAQRPDLMQSLFQGGLLTYDFYVQELSTFYSLPVSAFKATGPI
jgi:hypothetical protein